jgi:TolB-like protein
MNTKFSLTRRNVLLSLLALAVIVQGVTGCSKRFSDLPAFSALPFRDSYNYSVGRFKTSYLIDQIHAYFRGHQAGPIAVATFVDIDNLYTSSTFGRLLSEQIMSELAMKGYNVIELRQSEALQVMYDQGEFGLSRDITTLKGSQDVSGLVVGTYAVSPMRIYINARIVDPVSSLVVAAGSVEMPKTDEIERLLRTSVLPPTMERIPVRNLGGGFSASSYTIPWWVPPSNFGPRRFGTDSGGFAQPDPKAEKPTSQLRGTSPSPELGS